MNSVKDFRVLSSGYTPALSPWHTAIDAAFSSRSSGKNLVHRNMDDPETAHTVLQESRRRALFFFLVSQLGALKGWRVIERELSWFTWVFLSWHMADFSPDEADGEKLDCPLLAVFENAQPENWPECKILERYAIFVGLPPIVVAKLRDETRRRIDIDPNAEELPDFQKQRLRVLHTDATVQTGVPRLGDNLLFLKCDVTDNVTGGVLRRVHGDDLITAIPMIGKHERASRPIPAIRDVLKNDRMMPNARYAFLQFHDNPADSPAKTISCTVEGVGITIRRATFPTAFAHLDNDDKMQISYITAWIFEKPGKSNELTKAHSKLHIGNWVKGLLQ
jgi:hypothetical protein